MRPNQRPVKGDRRGVATIEFAYALPVVFVTMFGLADVVQSARANLRAQSAAIQIGQIVSQCEQVSADDEAVLKDLAQRILDPGLVKKAPFALRINVFGRDSANKDITPWSISQSGGAARPGEPALSFNSAGTAVPPGYTMGKNQVLIRTEVFSSVDRTPLQRAVSMLSRSTQASTAVSFGFGTAAGTAVHSTRVPNTDSLKTKGGSGAKGCLS